SGGSPASWNGAGIVRPAAGVENWDVNGHLETLCLLTPRGLDPLSDGPVASPVARAPLVPTRPSRTGPTRRLVPPPTCGASFRVGRRAKAAVQPESDDHNQCH